MITEEQLEKINEIWEILEIRFTGITKEDADKFILKYYNKAVNYIKDYANFVSLSDHDLKNN